MCSFVAVSAPPVWCVVDWQSFLGGISPLLRHGSTCVLVPSICARAAVGVRYVSACPNTPGCKSSIGSVGPLNWLLQQQHLSTRHTGDVVPPCCSSQSSVCCYLAPTCALPHAPETNRYNTAVLSSTSTKQHLLLYTSYLLQRCESATQYALPHPWGRPCSHTRSPARA